MNKYFNSYKGRNVHCGQRVEVYRNLNKSGTSYSIRDKKTGLVLGHAKNILLNSCIFKVNHVGRQRVLETKQKKIHAWIDGYFGEIHANANDIFSKGSIIKYNPYINKSFVHAKTGEPIQSSGVVYINEDGVFAHGFYGAAEVTGYTVAFFLRPIENRRSEVVPNTRRWTHGRNDL